MKLLRVATVQPSFHWRNVHVPLRISSWERTGTRGSLVRCTNRQQPMQHRHCSLSLAHALRVGSRRSFSRAYPGLPLTCPPRPASPSAPCLSGFHHSSATAAASMAAVNETRAPKPVLFLCAHHSRLRLHPFRN